MYARGRWPSFGYLAVIAKMNPFHRGDNVGSDIDNSIHYLINDGKSFPFLASFFFFCFFLFQGAGRRVV